MSLLGGQPIPANGPRKILRDTLATDVHKPKGVLSTRIPLLSG
jgi:hypothetical protein